MDKSIKAMKRLDPFRAKSSVYCCENHFDYCVCTVIPEVTMSFGGSTDPCATANLMSIGKLGVEENKKHAKVLFQFVQDQLGVPSDRMYITFQDEPTSNVGYQGTTFHDILG